MDPTAIKSHRSLDESSFISELMETSVLDSLFRDLPDSTETDQDSPALRDWFFELLHRCRGNEVFDQAVCAARSFVPEPGTPVLSAPLAATATHRLSLLGMHPTKPIPLHDHPDAWSAQMILSGRAYIRHCDGKPQTRGRSTLAYLKTATAREFRTEEISSVTPGARNIHGLAATAGNAVLLSIQRPSCNGARQSWFFPVEPPRRDDPLLLCHRVRTRTRVDTVR